MWGQSKTYLDSVNYYFGILLNHERDSINQYRIKYKTGKKILNRGTEEKDESKFVNPWKHIDYCIEESHQIGTNLSDAANRPDSPYPLFSDRGYRPSVGRR